MIKALLTNKYTYISLFSIIALGALSIFLIDKVVMPRYTNYNEGVTVPDVTRISLSEAEALLTSYGLRVEVSDRRAHSAFPADYVIDQAPSAAQIVKPNRKVYLTVNTAERPQVVMPNVENLSLRNAQIQLQNYGLVIGTTSYESSRFKNTVLRQSVRAGSNIDKGTIVDLVVSDGLGDKIVTVPEIIGLRLAEAQLKLREVGLRVDKIQFQPIEEVDPNIVLDFTPKVEELIEGESLSLVISERFDAVEEIEPGLIDTTQSTPPDSLRSKKLPDQK